MLGERIKEKRKEAKLTQTQLGDLAGVRKNTVSDWERGKYKPDIDTVAQIARILGTTATYLLDCEDGKDIAEDLVKHKQIVQFPYPVAAGTGEDEYVRKYRALDTHGKQAVQAIIDVEYARITRSQEETALFLVSEQPAAAGTGAYLGPDAFQPVEIRADKLPKDAAFGVPVSGNSMEPRYHDGDILIVSRQLPALGDVGVFIMEGQGYVKQLGENSLISLNPDYQPILMDESVRACGKVIGVLDEEDVIE